MNELPKIINILKKKDMQLSVSVERYNTLQKRIKNEANFLTLLEKAKAFVINVGEETRERNKKYIENTVTLALQSVFEGEYDQFIIEFETKRDQTEVRFLVESDGILTEPRQDTEAGGVVDVCSFALRMVVWTLENPASPPIMLLDEPFKNLSGGYLQKANEMVNELSDMLDLQIIMVTHIDEFIEGSNNVIRF